MASAVSVIDGKRTRERSPKKARHTRADHEQAENATTRSCIRYNTRRWRTAQALRAPFRDGKQRGGYQNHHASRKSLSRQAIDHRTAGKQLPKTVRAARYR